MTYISILNSHFYNKIFSSFRLLFVGFNELCIDFYFFIFFVPLFIVQMLPTLLPTYIHT